MDISALKSWFLAEKRDLPWRQNPTPYAVWISEVMLQQTQVAVVIPYFLRWMEHFPTVERLAAASLDEVIKMWEGLGYYSRARYLHEGARYLVSHFQGEFPQEEEQLKQIKGLGPYTIGAILSFAFHQKKAAVDGNVLRVLARYFKIEEDITKSSTQKQMRQLAEKILPDEEPWIVTEALIELGATICQRKARCNECPLKRSCQARLSGKAEELPIKSETVKTEYLYRAVALITDGSRYLVRRGKEGEIMRDLHEFPFFETEEQGILSKQLQQRIQEAFGLIVEEREVLTEIDHSFTRYQVRLRPVLFHCQHPCSIKDLEWKSVTELKQLAFSSGHRRLFQRISQHSPQAV